MKKLQIIFRLFLSDANELLNYESFTWSENLSIFLIREKVFYIVQCFLYNVIVLLYFFIK